ncbi:hypothetical protein Ciccas_013310 [Cichlidogyrus casuarinus]|uniref:BPTI/Kunitz inhibitor domain-containing protein n=1 Tax=Cichlidogyrus casuarinus TaxID=1844966 RepID=A0ABD2PMD8_9PLAT
MSSFAGFVIFLAAIGLAAGEDYNCVDKVDSMVCATTEIKWRFVKETGRCDQFLYGGCGTNRNRFDSRSDCENVCGTRVRAVTNCNDPKEESLCRASIQRYFYDRNTNKCESFIWGGCARNGNNFETLKECQDACVTKAV